MNNLLENELKKLIKEAVREVLLEEREKGTIDQKKRSLANNIASTEKQKIRDPNSIIRPDELSNMLSVSKVTLFRLEKDGDLPPKIRISHRAVGWRYGDIEKWLKSKE